MKQRVKSGVNIYLKRELEIFRDYHEYGSYPTENAFMESGIQRHSVPL